MLMNTGIKAGITGAVAGVGSMVFHGESVGMSIPIGSQLNLPAPVLVGAAAGLGSVAADAAHYWILPHIPGNQKYANLESAALGFATAGVGTMVTLNYLGGAGEKSMDAFLLGGASAVAGDYITEKIYPASGSSFGL